MVVGVDFPAVPTLFSGAEKGEIASTGEKLSIICLDIVYH
jgi:hypothetical protein